MDTNVAEIEENREIFIVHRFGNEFQEHLECMIDLHDIFASLQGRFDYLNNQYLHHPSLRTPFFSPMIMLFTCRHTLRGTKIK